MTDFIKPEFHELEQDEIDELTAMKTISKKPKQESELSNVLGCVFLFIALIALGIMLLAY